MNFLSPQNTEITGTVFNNHTTVQAAAEYSGYNIQYLRRLVQAGVISGTKIGQVWLVAISSLNEYLQSVQAIDDRRFGPHSSQLNTAEDD